MEWLFLLAIAVVIAYSFSRKAVVKPEYSWSKLPKITPEMIEPIGKPISRNEAAQAYIRFHARYLGTEETARTRRDELLDYISGYITMLEMERDETFDRLKEARRELREALEFQSNETDDAERAAWQPDINEIKETIRRRQERFDRQNAEIDRLKLDCRSVLVEFINDEVGIYKAAAGIEH